MTDNEVFHKLFSGGNHSLPYLIKFTLDRTNQNSTVYRFARNNENITYNGEEYTASDFEYNKPDSNGEGGSLSISGFNNRLIEFVEDANYKWKLEVVGIIAADGEVEPMALYVHFYGSVSYSDNMTINFDLGRDDRLDMTFPSYKFDTDNNTGNA